MTNNHSAEKITAVVHLNIGFKQSDFLYFLFFLI